MRKKFKKAALKINPMRLLFHVCCAHCYLSYAELLKDYQTTFFYYNPNIHPEEEYQQRLQAIQKISVKYHFPLIVGDYDTEKWFQAVKGLETEPENGLRCRVCFRLRLEQTAKIAHENGFTHFATALNLSPYKEIDYINQVGAELAKKYNLTYVSFPFSQEERRRLHFSAKPRCKEEAVYCQNYCGCVYSKRK